MADADLHGAPPAPLAGPGQAQLTDQVTGTAPSSIWILTRSSAAVSLHLLIGAAGAFALHALAAAVFGGSAALDAYYVGAAIPLVLVSAYTAGLMFIVAPLVSSGGEQADAVRRALPAASLAVITGVSGLVALTCTVLAGPIIGLLGRNLEPAVQPAAARVLAIQSWSPLLVGVAVWLSAHLVARGRPALASGGPAVGNFLALFVFLLARSRGDVAWIAWAVVAGAGAQLAFYMVALRLGKLAVQLPRLTRGAVGRAVGLIFPWLAAASIYKSHTLIDRVVGSWDREGAVTSLALGLTLVTVAATLLTRGIGLSLSPRLAAAGASARRDLWNGICAAILLLAPAACLVVVLRVELVSLLFGHGQFSVSNVADTAATLIPYSAVLVALGMGNIVTTTFYALGDTRTPATVGVAGLLVHGAVTLSLWPVFGYLAAGWGFAAMSTFSLSVLVFLLRCRMGPLADRRKWAAALVPVAVALICLPVLAGLRSRLEELLEGGFGQTALRGALAAASYLAAYAALVAVILRLRPGVD